MAAPQRFELLPSGRHLLPVGVGVGAVIGALAPSPPLQAAFLCGAALLGAGGLLLRRRRPALLLDEEGYRVESAGRERLRVAWAEVRRIYHDPAEAALYVDCGDPARNLLVPPERGWAFTFSDRERLVALVLAAAPDRVEQVADLRLGTRR